MLSARTQLFFFDMQAQKGVRLHGSSTVLDHFDLLALPRHAGRFEVFPSLGGEIFKTSWQCKFLLCSHEARDPVGSTRHPSQTCGCCRFGHRHQVRWNMSFL